jgi:hypothetical protein
MVPHALLPRLTLMGFLVFGLSACGRNHEDIPHHAEALIVCPATETAKSQRYEGIDHLDYRVKMEYPAESVISCISEKLSENGWQPLKEDFWNPGLPSSQVRGWTQFTDASVHPEATVDAWSTQWRNQAGDIVWYFLEYRYPPNDRYTLSVHAGFIPANNAKNQPKTPIKSRQP